LNVLDFLIVLGLLLFVFVFFNFTNAAQQFGCWSTSFPYQ